MSTRKLSQFDTGLTADTVEWCPAALNENIVACGTYQLDAEAGRRHGSLTVHKLTYNSQGESCTELLQDKLLEYGTLDMKWAAFSTKTLLALAASSGDVVFVALASQADTVNEECSVFEELGRVAVDSGNGKSGLCLSLDWNVDKSQQQVVAVSDSLGVVSIVNCQGEEFRVQRSWRAHEFEAWIVCLDRQSHLVFSGGDDCRLCAWDTRTSLEKPAMTSRQHTMGVCSLHPHPFQDHLLASGSYDERVLLWDVRLLRRPVKEAAVGGGVWRVKWHPTSPDMMATACMHNGFQILNWHLQDATAPETVCSYSEHDSLAYGVSWSKVQTEATSTHLLASCSFYDHSLHFWTATF